jgi:hypothetical protein
VAADTPQHAPEDPSWNRPPLEPASEPYGAALVKGGLGHGQLGRQTVGLVVPGGRLTLRLHQAPGHVVNRQVPVLDDARTLLRAQVLDVAFHLLTGHDAHGGCVVPLRGYAPKGLPRRGRASLGLPPRGHPSTDQLDEGRIGLVHGRPVGSDLLGEVHLPGLDLR